LKGILTITFLLVATATFSQEKYWVYFADKDGVTINPEVYFHPKAIARRDKINYPLNHFTDLPVKQAYVDQVLEKVIKVKGTSRWFNAAVVIAEKEQINSVQKLPFVQRVESDEYTAMVCVSNEHDSIDGGFEKKDLIRFQVERMQAQKFALNGYKGKGKLIAIFDAGFPGVDDADLFKHIRARNGIKGTFDFIRNTENVYRKISHGSTVLSCIAGIKDDSVMIGVAPEADFLLAITEKLMKEGLAEEEAWLFAAEWADKNGVDIINSSLGYTRRNSFKHDMDGNTAVITRAANMASSKGILVVSSAGNEGDKKHWMMMAAPADGDSVLAVGAINPWSGYHTSFSSFGPSADKELKPNVTAIGHVMAYGVNKKVNETQGTSFSAPLITGFAACAWEAKPDLTNWELLKEIEKSGDLYPYFDYAHGYGVPQASHFMSAKNTQHTAADSVFSVKMDGNLVTVAVRNDFLPVDSLFAEELPLGKVAIKIQERLRHDRHEQIDREHPFAKQELFYYHIENDSNYLDEFSVVSVDENPILQLDIEDLKGKTVRFHYRGVTEELKLKK